MKVQSASINFVKVILQFIFSVKATFDILAKIWIELKSCFISMKNQLSLSLSTFRRNEAFVSSFCPFEF